MPAELASWNGQYNLLGQYLQLQGDNAAAKNTHRLSALYQQIVDLVRSDAAGGTVRQIIAQAESDKSKTVEDAKARADRFERLYAQFKANPETQNIFIERMWLNELDEILSSPIISKHIYPGGSTEPIILELNPDPNVEREIRNERRRRATDNTVREVAPDQEGM